MKGRERAAAKKLWQHRGDNSDEMSVGDDQRGARGGQISANNHSISFNTAKRS